MGLVDYDAVLADLEQKRVELESAIVTLRRVAGRDSVKVNPFQYGNGSQGINGSQVKPVARINGAHGLVNPKPITMGFGRSKGVPLNQLTPQDLQYYKTWLENAQTDSTRPARFRNNDLQKLNAVLGELSLRGLA